MSERVYITNGLRTPFGSFGGSLKDIEVETLAALVIKELVSRSKIAPEEINAVHLGCANTAESKDVIAPVIARQALLKAGLPVQVLSSTVDKACCSGTEAIKKGFDAIRLGEADVVIAGGVQTMSRAPLVVRNVRWGNRLGNLEMEDCLFASGYKDYNLHDRHPYSDDVDTYFNSKSCGYRQGS
ncbi:MAG: beta-ketoacyl synthase N-terminal-like domain-containing protein [Thermincola sp.]|jgi:acetyl-CoA C-acetyltransferase|nr:beta-ketoacyl synthase N-terminal-like domain-containing protein [Thermincola sp.]MDT3704618.1 beta-ketoacyl synthase N-terminal-like domain-containing protein [Thermincola sp.]